MVTYLERYLAGEHELVWEELRALEERVQEQTLFDDAMAVAHETMRRARINLEIIVQRLGDLGYVFGYAGRDAEIAPNVHGASDVEIDAVPAIVRTQFQLHRLTQPFEAAQPGDTTRVHELREQYGPFPLALIAWYEEVGAVNLVGNMPVTNPLELEGFTNLYQYRFAHARDDMDSYSRPTHDCDPLWVYPIRVQAARLPMPPASRLGRRALLIAPSAVAKQGFNAPGEYEIVLPNARADARLVGEPHGLTFVNYLRYCFRWGGFPGLDQRTRPPLRELDILTRDLLTI